MIDLARCWAARALVAALPLVGLAACATPTLIDHVGIEPERPPDAPPRVLDRTARLQCAPFARQASGIQIYGNANTWWRQAAGRYPRSNVPAPGSVLVLRGYHNPGRGHVAVVTAVVSSRVIRVDQANWLNGGEITVALCFGFLYIAMRGAGPYSVDAWLAARRK